VAASLTFQAFCKASLASSIGCCHGGECNTPICLQFGCAWSVIMRDSQGREQRHASHKRHAFQRMGPAELLALSFTTGEEACSEEWQTIVDRRWMNAGQTTQRPCLLDRCSQNTRPSSNTSYRCCQSHSKVHDWHADSSRGIIVELRRERIAPRISSRTSLKCCIHFGFILKLTIFICKQLKRLAAFRAVQA